jgi:hypothetical protein
MTITPATLTGSPGAGTQLKPKASPKPPAPTGDLANVLSMTSGWNSNIAVAECIVRRPSIGRSRRTQNRVDVMGSA